MTGGTEPCVTTSGGVIVCPMTWGGNAQIALELEAIPRGRFEQNVLRAVFQNYRANDLGRKAEYPGSTVEETIVRAVALVRDVWPAFEPHIKWVLLARLRSGSP